VNPSPRETLLTVPNHHVPTDGGTNHPPAFDEATDFVAYSPNVHGEQMVFVQKAGEQEAVLYHGDYAWQPVRVAHGMPEELNADAAELLFIASCWMQSKPFRAGAEAEADPPILDALQAIGTTMQQLVLLNSLARGIGG
jgi:hypothetical protein